MCKKWKAGNGDGQDTFLDWTTAGGHEECLSGDPRANTRSSGRPPGLKREWSGWWLHGIGRNRNWERRPTSEGGQIGGCDDDNYITEEYYIMYEIF